MHRNLNELQHRKIPHAKTVLSAIKEPEKKRKLDPEKMSKLLKLIRDENPETGGGDMNEKAMGIFLQRQEVLDIFICPESKLKAKPCQHSMQPSGDAGTGPGTEESTQTQDLFKRIRKYPVAPFPAFSTPSPTALNPGAPVTSAVTLLFRIPLS
jgi:hypothetical protein